MTNSKHTPGPWHFSHDGTLKAGERGTHLGTFSEAVGLGHAAAANRALIAAAPELVAALRDCLVMLDDCGNDREVLDWFQRVDAARAALAKVA